MLPFTTDGTFNPFIFYNEIQVGTFVGVILAFILTFSSFKDFSFLKRCFVSGVFAISGLMCFELGMQLLYLFNVSHAYHAFFLRLSVINQDAFWILFLMGLPLMFYERLRFNRVSLGLLIVGIVIFIAWQSIFVSQLAWTPINLAPIPLTKTSYLPYLLQNAGKLVWCIFPASLIKT